METLYMIEYTTSDWNQIILSIWSFKSAAVKERQRLIRKHRKWHPDFKYDCKILEIILNQPFQEDYGL